MRFHTALLGLCNSELTIQPRWLEPRWTFQHVAKTQLVITRHTASATPWQSLQLNNFSNTWHCMTCNTMCSSKGTKVFWLANSYMCLEGGAQFWPIIFFNSINNKILDPSSHFRCFFCLKKKWEKIEKDDFYGIKKLVSSPPWWNALLFSHKISNCWAVFLWIGIKMMVKALTGANKCGLALFSNQGVIP